MYIYQAIYKNLVIVNKPKPIIKSMPEQSIDLISQFERHLIINNYSKKTIKNYKNTVVRLIKFINNKYNGQINKASLNAFVMQFIGYSSSQINLIHYAIEKFLKTIIKSKVDYKLPVARLPKQLPHVLTREEVKNLLNSTTDIKYKTIFAAGYSEGLRISEVINLKYSDIQRDRKKIHIKLGKNRKDRIIPLSESFTELLKEYSLNQGHNSNFSGDYIFQNRSGEPLSEEVINKNLRISKINAGIKKKCTFHCLRHAFATHLYEDTKDIFAVKEWLGHEDITTTCKYIACAKIEVNSPFDLLNKYG